MEKINRLINNADYILNIQKINQAEEHRSFCRHNMEHFLDVARIAMIINLEESIGIHREMIYGAALLHDVGRWVQYDSGTPHEQAGALIAPVILRESGFNESEITVVSEAIINHRNGDIKEQKSLKGLLYRADKLSRPCYNCRAEKECDQKQGKKNMEILV